MFVCQICNETAKSGTPRRLVVLEKRPKTYKNIVRRSRQNDRGDTEYFDETVITEGYEAAREVAACPYGQQTGSGEGCPFKVKKGF